jgi:AcrR family transcriptional regulator
MLMPMNMNDLRVKKTRRSLREAFIRLILQQGYDSISIQDIANEAETARVTFYRHYKDKEELLTDCLNVLYEEMAERIPPLTPETAGTGYNPMREFFRHLEEQERLYSILFSSRGTQTVIERMRHHLAKRAIEGLQTYFPDAGKDIPLEILGYFTASAQIGLGIWWLDHDKPYSREYMAQVSVWLTLGGVLRGLGIDRMPPFEKPTLESHS